MCFFFFFPSLFKFDFFFNFYIYREEKENKATNLSYSHTFNILLIKSFLKKYLIIFISIVII